MEKVSVLCLFFALSLSFACAGAENDLYSNADLTLETGLSWTFYKSTCPKLESIVEKRIKFYLKKDITQAAGLLRLHFHDCFVQGCDASVLLDGSASGPSEQEAPPNLTLRQKAFEIINDIKEHVDKACDEVVSCADITALAARDSVSQTGGPKYSVPLGRRDSLEFATRAATLANLPGPNTTASALIDALAAKGLDATDLVALSGGHTIGIGHCASFEERLYPTQDSTLAKSFAKNLKVTCPSTNVTNTTVLDIRSPNIFDNKYYVDLKNREGLFTSDQDLYTDSQTKPIVKEFAHDQDLFFEKFSLAMAKMGQLSVLTGIKGEIRINCSARNPTPSITTVVEEDADSAEL
ncbi:peroxidase 12 [Cryptomeria japonica]|uniref:peroxidase 12 n=1 Tax=Cryptomeria japonica TaxID=3369 RepID=UPI0027DA6237|nr:peroxidase 12 [Cryptomeria japonica]